MLSKAAHKKSSLEFKVTSVRKTYLLALGLLLLTMIANFLTTVREYSEEAAYDAIINTSGRQRMLSQRLALLARDLVELSSPEAKHVRSEILLSLEEFSHSHTMLKGDERVAESVAKDRIQRLDLLLKQILDKVHTIIQETDSKEIYKQSRELEGITEVFLPLMDSTVDAITNRATSVSHSLHAIRKIIFFTQMFLLAIVTLIFFEPLIRRIKRNEDRQQQQQLTLESTSKRLELALQATHTGLWDWNVVDDSTYFNDSWYTMLGYEPNELPMNLDTWKMLCHPEDLPKAYEKISNYLSGETPLYSCEQRLKRKDGSWMWINDVGKAVERGADGKATRLIGVHIDIELLKEKEKQLSAAKEKALLTAQNKGEFLANMSHEIRTPMNGVLGMTELLLESKLDEYQYELAQSAYQSADALLTIINDVLDFSKIEAGKIQISPYPFSLREFLSNLEVLHRIRFEQKDVSFIWIVEEDVPDKLLGDRDRIQQVLVNLMGNALKFTPKGGGIILRAARDSAGASSTVIRFTVADTGIGIPESKQKAIFQAFEQADESITRDYGGTGLGLAISSRLIDLMDGEIGLESIEGSGTRFYFTLELKSLQEGKDAESLTNEEQEEYVLPSLNILLAEDNLINQKLMRHVLENSGSTLTIAKNGEEAIEIFERDSFDLVLMDIQMPIMGGVEATEAIRKLERGKEVPIIALTAHAMEGDREKYLQAGMNDYVSKPIDRKQFTQVVCQVTNRTGNPSTSS